ncbi:MAG: hypothetical protein ACOX6D_04140 [Thermoguttaceae bacterium]|jgi:hypothetical protein
MRNHLFFGVLFFISGFLVSGALPSALSAQERNEWPSDCKIGIFLHFLPGGDTADAMQANFQVERLADQIASTGVDYFGMTMYQNSGWFNAPTAPYDEVTGYRAGERCCPRDIPMEMADALARRGIKFFVYVTGQVPNRDKKAQAAYGLEVGPKDQVITPQFAKKWAEVFRHWSERYGRKVFGWWVDGCYTGCEFNEEIAQIYREALLAGNPDAVVAFNPGVKAPEWKTSDFTAGEINHPFEEKGFAPKNGIGQKEQILTFQGRSWSAGGPRYSTEEWIDWAKPAIDAGLALTIDTGLTVDEKVPTPGGFRQESLDQIRAIVDAVKGYSEADSFKRAVEYDWLRQEITAGRSLESPEALTELCRRTQALLNAQEEERYISESAAEKLQREIDAVQTENLAPLGAGQIKERYLKLRWQAREAIFDNQLVKGIPIVFLKADRYIWQLIHEYLSYYYSHTNMVGGDLMILKNPGRSFEVESISAGKFPRGWFSTPSLSFDGKTLYFAFADFSQVVPERAPRKTLHDIIARGYDNEIETYLQREEGKYHLFKMDLETGRTEQLTFGPDDDFDPAELPDGDLVFVSTRRGGFARCTARYEPVETATLHRRTKDGKIKCLSWHETNEWNPSVLDDGRILYARWDYVDREAARFMNLWVTNPDGTGARVLFGNYTPKVVASLQAKQVPDSNKILFIGSGHHVAVGGPLVLLDPSKVKYDPTDLQDTLDGIEVLSPEIAFPETAVPGTGNTKYYVSDHYYYSPYPLSEDYYLTAYSHDPNGGYLARHGYGYNTGQKEDHYVGSCGESYSAGKLGLYYRDRFGNLELIYADPQVSCRYPIPIKPRPKPPVIATQLPQEEAVEGTFVLSDVYDSIAPLSKDRPIKQLRIFQILPHWPEYASKDPPLGKPNAANGRAFLGTVPVEADGSAHFKVPAGKPLYFQAVDAEGKAVRTMMSEVYLQPGENRGCVGCHEQIQTASENFPAQKRAFQRPPSVITPGPAGTAPFSFPLFVQPVLDRHCVSCHNGEEGSDAPDLRGIVENGDFSNAYNNLIDHTRWYHWGRGTIATIASRPGEGGADMSELTEILDNADHGEKIGLSDEERRAFYLWMDANVPFYGTAESATRAMELRGEPVPMPPVQ